MKKIFILAEANISVKNVIDNFFRQKQPKLAIFTTIQYLKEVQEYIKKNKLKNILFGGQILGCDSGSAEKVCRKVNAFLYVGTGEFHPGALIKFNKKIFIANPENNSVTTVELKDVEALEKVRRGKISKFLLSKKVGVIFSVKPGQSKFDEIKRIKRILNSFDKEYYFFIGDEIKNLEDFIGIDMWINTACPRIEGKNIINLDDLESSYE